MPDLHQFLLVLPKECLFVPPLVALRYVIYKSLFTEENGSTQKHSSESINTNKAYFQFIDNVIFAQNGLHGSIEIPLQQVTSLPRRAQAANAPAASYSLRRVLDDGRHRSKSVLQGVPVAKPAMHYCLVLVAVFIQSTKICIHFFLFYVSREC